mmetsp:Transcript_44502/g.117686  ORF Transcript_44502/g.117686 Transcript_44502/m.117686 type:complete len:218 (+) Transcript_44502:628-1281(+)
MSAPTPIMMKTAMKLVMVSWAVPATIMKTTRAVGVPRMTRMRPPTERTMERTCAAMYRITSSSAHTASSTSCCSSYMTSCSSISFPWKYAPESFRSGYSSWLRNSFHWAVRRSSSCWFSAALRLPVTGKGAMNSKTERRAEGWEEEEVMSQSEGKAASVKSLSQSEVEKVFSCTDLRYSSAAGTGMRSDPRPSKVISRLTPVRRTSEAFFTSMLGKM